MKIALCLFGLVGGSAGKNGKGGNMNPEIVFEFYYKHILTSSVDVYFHTWSVDQKEKLIELYNPKRYIFEPQITFSKNAYSHRAHSRWYSTQKSINLAEGDYDMIMLSRFDVAFLKDIDFLEYDSEYFYASHWNDSGKRNNHTYGFLDLWFFGGSEIMRKFGQLYDSIDKYNISQHIAAKQHLEKITGKIKYVMYRGEDFEMARRVILNCKE